MNRLTALLAALPLAFAQNAPQPARPSASIRVDVNLVQVDAVITDSKNRRVTNLQAADVELLQDGKPQTITNFSYISTKLAGAPARTAPAKPPKGEPPPPAPVLQPTEVGRTVALVVDDMGLAAENIPAVRGAIRNFLDQQMRPNDLVAIVRTGAGMGALQQFTTDKRLLYAALDRVKYGQSRVGLSSFAPLGSTNRATAGLDHFREETMAVGSLGAIRYVVNAMAGFPGRKSVILFTENIRMIFRNVPDEMVDGAVQQLSDAASRASVVINAIEPRGIPDLNVTAADDTSRMSGRRVSRVPAQRQEEVIHTEEGMFVLAQQTGGLFLHDSNDMADALRQEVDDSDGYYLIGYHPDAGTFESGGSQPRFHRIEVKVKRPGLHVRSREGFFGTPGNGIQPAERTREAQLNRALQSPYAGAIHPRVTAVFSHVQAGSFVNALVFFNPGELKWSGESDGSQKAAVDFAAVTFDENGLALSTVDKTFTLQLSAQQYVQAMKQGIVYGLHVPIGKPGPYLMRAALRDPATESIGSAEQFVEVPDLDSGHLALSGILLRDAAQPDAELPEGMTLAQEGRRTFQPGAAMAYSYEVFNAGTGAEVQTRLFHDGQEVLAGTASSDTTAGAARRSGRLALGRNIPAGEYVLQVIVTDKLAKSKFNTATQSVDFEIEP